MPPSLLRREGDQTQRMGGNGFRRTAEDKARRRLGEGTLGRGGDGDEEGLAADNDGSRGERFALQLPGNRFRELEVSRGSEKADAIKRGLIQDPESKVTLNNAIEFRGSCTDMCPLYEREEREFKRDLHFLEMIPADGEKDKDKPRRVDHAKAVTIYHRPAAGNDQPLPSDVRTPPTLARTLDYLFQTVISLPVPPTRQRSELSTEAGSLLDAHGFVRDRTRGIRQDFSFQRSWGNKENVDAHERIGRFHILSMYELGKFQEKADPSWLQQEAEQLNKTLITLIELYDDQRLEGATYPNEPEFRAYQLLSHLNDNEVPRAILDLPSEIFNHPLVQLAFDFRALAQRNFDTQKVGRGYNAEISLNFTTRFFKMINQPKVPYLIACLAHSKLRDVRRASVRAMDKAYGKFKPPFLTENRTPRGTTLPAVTTLLGCIDETETTEILRSLDIDLLGEDGEISSEPLVTALFGKQNFNDNADAPVANPSPHVAAKRSGSTFQQIIDGNAQTAHGGRQPLTQRKLAVLPSIDLAAVWRTLNGPPLISVPEPPPTLDQSRRPSPAASHTPFSFPAPAPIAPPNRSAAPIRPMAIAQDTPSVQPSEPALTKPLTKASSPPQTTPIESRQRTSSRSTGAGASPPQFPAFTTTTPQNTPPARLQPVRSLPALTPFSVIKPPSLQPGRAPLRKSPTHAPRPSGQQTAVMAQSISAGLIGKLVETEVSMAIQQAFSEEAQLDSAKRGLVVQALSNSIEADFKRRFFKKTLADMYREIRIVHLQALAFRHWIRLSRLRAEEHEKTRVLRAEKEHQFRSDVTRMDLGASTLGRSSTGKSRVNKPLSGIILDAELDDEEFVEARLANIAKRKAILEPGTFWSVLGNHIMRIPSEDEPISAVNHDRDEEVDVNITLDVSDSSQGNWLRRKFNMDSVERYSAHFADEHMRSGYLTMNYTRAIDDTIDDACCLVIFECPKTISKVERQRLQRVVSRLPRRKRFRISLLVITWRYWSLDDFWREIGLVNSTSPFWKTHIEDMSTDATDNAFAEATDKIMSTLAYNPQVRISVESFVAVLKPGWENLCAFAGAVIRQGGDEYERLGKLAWTLVAGLDKVHRVLAEALDGLGASTEGIEELRFAELPSGDSAWRDASTARSSLAKLMANQGSEVGNAVETIAPAIRHRLEQYYDEPSEIVIPLLSELSRTIFAHYSAQEVSIYAEDLPEAEVAALRAKKEFEVWTEGCRVDVARLGTGKSQRGRKSSGSSARAPPPGKIVAPRAEESTGTAGGSVEFMGPAPPASSPYKGRKRTFSATSAQAPSEDQNKFSKKRFSPPEKTMKQGQYPTACKT